MLYRMMTDRLPFEANNDLESLLRVQKAEFLAPQEAKPTIGESVAAIIRRAMRLHPAERYQTADEMLVEVERVLRTEFHSAGQTELKSWLEQLGRRDSAPSIGKAPRDAGGVVKDVDGDRFCRSGPRSSFAISSSRRADGAPARAHAAARARAVRKGASRSRRRATQRAHRGDRQAGTTLAGAAPLGRVLVRASS